SLLTAPAPTDACPLSLHDALPILKLREDANAMLAAAQATREDATHEDNKAENKYDTRGLEASYLAEAQARQAEEAGIGLARFEADRKSTRLNSSHVKISYAVFCLK